MEVMLLQVPLPRTGHTQLKSLLLCRPAWTHWGPLSCAPPSALPLAWSCLPHLLLTTPHRQLWPPTFCKP